MQDSPPWNSSTTAGTTCYVNAWVQVPAGLKAYLRTTEQHGTSIVARHTFSVSDASGSWVLVGGAAPIINGGDTLQMRIYAPLAVGQTLLVDDIFEACFS